ncbi:pentapeptide repeat-containing protein [Streptomyces canus]|uniref:pentapeptide repeat-containing protein n=1 Tax=Streptomyces canus TaxID=58343 RepID=UPI0027D8C558|nr:pentapeptide repeat-containing protein [Streptomyces canus]
MREQERQGRRLTGRSRAISVIVVCGSLLLVTLVTVVAPRYLLSWDAPATPASERAKAINDIRTTLLQGLAGVALLVGAFFTWRQLQVSSQGQITQRFTAAVEQLGSTSPEVRFGAIFALERIADDSQYDRVTIAEVLCAFVKRNGPADPLAERPVPRDAAHKRELVLARSGDDPLPVRSADRQAAMTVLGRRARAPYHHVLELDRTDLRGARLAFANLVGADLHYSDLSDVNLESADLRGADLTSVWLAGAFLRDAQLHQADLRSAILWHTRLEGADLRATDLTGAELTGADLNGTRLDQADLRGADLTGTEASRASLSGAVADAATIWPAGFDAAAAGVITDDGSAPPLRSQSWHNLLQ